MTDLAQVFTARTGVVATFDDRAGAGTVVDSLTGSIWPFHCTSLVDGGRTVPAGAAVAYRVEPGPTGLEAVSLTPT